METERLSPRYRGIDGWEPSDMFDALAEGQFAAVAAVRCARAEIVRAALATAARLSDGGRLAYAGAGTSGRLAVQDGAELMPTFGWPAERLVVIMAGGERALTEAVEGAEDQPAEAERRVAEAGIGPADVLIGVAASGTTAFTLACVREAGRRGAVTVGIASNAGTPLLAAADHPILLDTGAEPIAGSTRLKAGTAQKIALNVLSSMVMIRLGRVHEGLMVEVQPVNAKLVARSEDMLSLLTDRSREDVRAALHEAGGRVKLAALLLRGCGLAEAEALLERSGGRLRAALEVLEGGTARQAP
ncbi:N-acetylmuramic acid 6-phosphate etherase [Propylenella binzhouense]|uniref:N-acetylmuramic acid 6-phosphate etherase n=1 Tax=Propylenella binzhouense TaxID=2555902 RepID=A0A964T5V8_9HYPH|nr:N-acetylmuramic acid 6-phosphate etherase [Propylenella binzhouense]MYZ48990.1 N-acetylmuramic acid 6-phosphate etherase [Propylenella binzhouense]